MTLLTQSYVIISWEEKSPKDYETYKKIAYLQVW